MDVFTYLGLKNFRAFEKAAVNLAPITIFVGPNNAGKSSIVSALRLLAQTASSEDFRIPLFLNGPMGDFGTYRDLVYQNKRKRNIGIALGCTVSQRTQQRESQLREARIDLNFAYRSQRREVVLLQSALYDQGRRLVSTTYSPDSEKHSVKLFSPRPEVTDGTIIERPVRMIHFLVPLWQVVSEHSRRKKRPEVDLDLRRTVLFGDSAFRSFFEGLQGIEYLGPFRAVPQRTILFSGERPARVGMDGGKALHLLASDYLRKGRLKKKLSNEIVLWLKSADLANDLKVRVLSDRHFEMLIQNPWTQEFENLADVGYGISQVLPVIAGGYNMDAGSTFIVEEPEIHLHPRAQASLGDFFAGLYERRVQCILETHSEHLIVRLQKHVASGRIKAKDLIVHYVHAPGESKEVVTLTIKDDGLFAEKWPRGFFEDRLEEVTALARSSQGTD
ncbi:MAG: DUF3696 domain-containing protein [Acidobacteria bacterium]|nr:DUF3696 domain-containing protein [Acidobacteriota bacterium]